MNTVMKKVKQARLELVLLALANIALGVVMIIKPDDAVDFIFRAIGIVLALWGVIRIINYFRVAVVEAFGSFGLVQGVALIAFGAYLIVKPDIMGDILAILASILIIIGAVIKVQYVVDLSRMRCSNWWIELIGAIVLVVLGVIALFNPFSTQAAIMIFIGISLVLDGLLDLASIIRISIMAKRVGKEVKNAMKKSGSEVIEGEVIVRE